MDPRDRIVHLLRRAAFGASPAETEAYLRLGYDHTVEALLHYDRTDDSALEISLTAEKLDFYSQADLQRWWLLRMIRTKRPLQEKMTLFWHGLLVSGTAKVGVPKPTPEKPSPPQHLLVQNRLFRANATGNVTTLLKAISRDPAMLIYLDNRDNNKRKPNENYARELIELFSLGRTGPDGTPNYTEDDVREAARALTGWGLSPEQTFLFKENQHDTGTKTIFGKVGPWGGDDLIDLIVSHPNHARHFCARLFRFFVADRPNEEALAPLIAAYRTSHGDVGATLRALFHSPSFTDPSALRARVKSPVEFMVGAIRTLGLETNAVGLSGTLQKMGQTLFNPPNVAGWPSGSRWLSTSTWLERVNFANRVAVTRQDKNLAPVSPFRVLQASARGSPEAVADELVRVLLDGRISAEQRQVLVAYLRDGNLWPKSRAPKETDAAIDRKVRGAIYLVLAMPEYHLA